MERAMKLNNNIEPESFPINDKIGENKTKRKIMLED